MENKFVSFKDMSLTNLGRTLDPKEGYSSADVELGCLQRIADASEKVATFLMTLSRENSTLRTRVTDMEKTLQNKEAQIKRQKSVISRLEQNGK